MAISAGTLTMPRKKREDVSVKIDAKVYRQAKMVATHREITLAEYLSELLEKPVGRDFQKLRQEMAQDETE